MLLLHALEPGTQVPREDPAGASDDLPGERAHRHDHQAPGIPTSYPPLPCPKKADKRDDLGGSAIHARDPQPVPGISAHLFSIRAPRFQFGAAPHRGQRSAMQAGQRPSGKAIEEAARRL